MTAGLTELNVNGRAVELAAESGTPLLYVLRNDLGLKGTRFGCGSGECGACMVLVDGAAEMSCQLPLSSVKGKDIQTIEGLAVDGRLSAVQQAVIDHQAGQCAYCLSGIIMAAEALLKANPSPSEEDVRQGLSRNLCRCGIHARIIAAVLSVAESKG